MCPLITPRGGTLKLSFITQAWNRSQNTLISAQRFRLRVRKLRWSKNVICCREIHYKIYKRVNNNCKNRKCESYRNWRRLVNYLRILSRYETIFLLLCRNFFEKRCYLLLSFLVPCPFYILKFTFSGRHTRYHIKFITLNF